MPEHKKNILNFGYGINFKYEGMLVCYFDRCYVVTKFILPTISALKILTINFDEAFDYLQEKKMDVTKEAKEYISDLRVYCNKILSFVHYYRKEISFLITQHIKFLMNENSFDFTKSFHKIEEERGIITLLIAGFLGLAYESISSFLHKRRHKALYKAIKAMKNK